MLKFFRCNYQLFWEQQDQNAYVHFPQVLTEIELLRYVIIQANKHLHYRDPTWLNITHLELIILDNQFLVEISEVSHNRHRSIGQDINLPQHIPNPSENAPIQNVSKPSDITTNNPQSNAITNDSNILQIPIHNVTQNTLPNQNHINTDSNQDGTFTISTSDTNITPQLQTEQPPPRKNDPPSIPPQYTTETLSHTSPQPGSSTQ